MQKKHLLSKKVKGWLIFFIVIGLIVALMFTGGKYSSPGFYGHLSIPGRFLLVHLASFVGGYGSAIIVLTAIVRLCLLPAMLKQARNGAQRGMILKAYMPQIKAIRKKIVEAKKKDDKAEYKKQSKNLSDLYHNHRLSLGNMGCMSMFAQIPIFGALYATIRYSPEIQRTKFFGINLGKSSLLIAVFVFLLYFIDSLIIYYNNRKSNQAKTKDKDKKSDSKGHTIGNTIIFVMPVWLAILSKSTSAGLALYWCVGGLFMIAQQLYVQHMTPKYKAIEKKRLRQNNL